ncbi:MAG: gamma-glutamyltransferase [Desulfovibrio sp.]|nr:gamma-glutamyltransferase [Desulfovibrio sp.]
MVTSPHYLASEAGLALLRRGANAVEAAIAMATTLAVVYPHMCTLGGDAFWLVYNADSKHLTGINASGRAAAKATIEAYRSRGFTRIPYKGPLAANTVPGMVSGLEKAYHLAQEIGGTFTWSELLESALLYALDGFPQSISYCLHGKMMLSRCERKADGHAVLPEFRRIFLSEYACQEGAVFRQPDLARNLAILAKEGPRAFYEGEIAHAIVHDLETLGGLLTLEDFASHTATMVSPICVSYHGLEAWNLPPNSQGMASLSILNILDNLSLPSSLETPEALACYVDTLVCATKEAFRDRDRYLTDPDFSLIPLEKLLGREHGRRQAERVCAGKTMSLTYRLDPAGDTVWFGVVDAFGNAVSYIQSIYYDFGSGVVPKGTGILLQNRGAFFSLDPRHVNALAPGKRTFHTLNPAMLLKEGKPFLVYGTMGGEGQPQTQSALVTRIVDYGMTPMEAISEPRWLYGSAFGEQTNSLKIEDRFGKEVERLLSQRGHSVSAVDGFHEMMGHAGAILIEPRTGVLQGGTDIRSDGLATGF